jgi:glycosyltransferase involved in cell wall biosynthesis
MDQLISVIIPAYNQARYLKSAINSVLSQTYLIWECIVVDDGSTDNTSEIVHKFRHPKIKYIYQRNSGLSAARNAGLLASKGDYISFLDSDDCFSPQKFEILLELFKNNPKLALAAGTAALIDENGNPINRNFETVLPKNSRELLFGNPLHVGSVLLKREWYQKVGLFDTSLRSYEDWDYWLRLAIAGGEMESVGKIVSFYRFHTAQMTKNTQQMTEASFAVLKKVFEDPNVLQDWLPYKSKAYSHSYLRASANAYLDEDFTNAQAYINEACRLNPELLSKNGTILMRKVFGWSELPKVKSPFKFQQMILNHLPQNVNAEIKGRKSAILAEFTIQKAFEFYRNQDFFNTFYYLKQGIRLNWAWLLNRGVVKIFFSLLLNGKYKEIKPDYFSNNY